MGWTTVPLGGDLVKWDAPKTVRGIYLGSEVKEKDGKTNLLHKVDTDTGTAAFFGTMLLNEGLKKIEQGAYIEVEYTGKETKTPNGRMKIFSVRKWEGEQGDVGDAPPDEDQEVPF